MELAIDYAVKALYLVMMLSLPPIVVASAVGIVLSLIQAITQLQEQTLTFGVKLLAVGLTLFLMGGRLGGEILRYAGEIFNRFYLIRNAPRLARLLLFFLKYRSQNPFHANIIGINTIRRSHAQNSA